MSGARTFPRACVASPHYLASAAGADVLARGGNALDAAVAINLTLGVVTPYLCGFGGDLFAMIWRDGVHAYNGSGAAPAAATPHAMRALARADRLPARGPLTVTVPGAVEAWFALLERFGTMSFEALAKRALTYAEDGFVPTARGGASFKGSKAAFAGEQEWMNVYGVARAGARLRQPGLARTIRALATEGPAVYYQGEIADDIAEHLHARGSPMRKADLEAHRGEWVSPISANYRGVDILEMPPNTQGVGVLEALLVSQGVPSTLFETATRDHVLIEATKLALADVGANVTDPRFMRAPVERLLEPSHVDAMRARIDAQKAGDPPRWNNTGGGTAYMCAADADGMCVSLIQSNFAGFGSGVTVPAWGINLHNRGTWFSLDDTDIDVIAPGKRPMHTLIPAMALRDGTPWLVLGTMGGDAQVQIQVQLLTRMIDDGEDPQAAIDAPRWAVDPSSWKVVAEQAFDDGVLGGLRARGHDVVTTQGFHGHAHAIMLTQDGYIAGTDPRCEGAALGF